MMLKRRLDALYRNGPSRTCVKLKNPASEACGVSPASSNRASPCRNLLGEPAYRTGGVVLLHVGRALVTPTEGHEYVPTDGAVTVPIGAPDDP
jgi:hypothetical protein